MRSFGHSLALQSVIRYSTLESFSLEETSGGYLAQPPVQNKANFKDWAAQGLAQLSFQNLED